MDGPSRADRLRACTLSVMVLTPVATIALALPTSPAWERWMGPDAEQSRGALVLFIAAVLLHCGTTLVILAGVSALLPGEETTAPGTAPGRD